MQRPSQLRGHAGADPDVMKAANAEIDHVKVDLPEGESDSEYENVPKKAKSTAAGKSVQQPLASEPAVNTAMDVDDPAATAAVKQDDMQQEDATTNIVSTTVSDDDWLRSRTSRLLGLAENDDDDAQTAPAPTTSLPPVQPVEAESEFGGFEDDPSTNDKATPVSAGDAGSTDLVPVNELEEKIRQSQRLYIRNLSYQVKEDTLRETFDGFGNLDEVSQVFLSSPQAFFVV